jgi:membrane protease YdiL (CAAX protease family)
MKAAAGSVRPLAPEARVLALALAAVLVAWGNAASVVLGSSAALPGGSGAYAAAGLALAAASLLAARAMGLDASALALRGRHVRGAAIGAALGVGVAVAGVVALRSVAPLVVGGAVEYAPLAHVDAPDLARHVVLLLPLGVILPEEIAFRGVLLGALARMADRRAAIAGASAAFALWHVSVVVTTVGQTTLAPSSLWSALGIVAALVVVGAGGAVFATLRLATGSLATAVAAHWAFDAAVLIGLWATRSG